MASKKKLSIGITINLEHYENIRLEVEGEVETPDDAGALVGYLDEVLSGFGRDDPAVRSKVDSYRWRVLGHGTGAPAAEQTALVTEEIEEVLIAERPVPVTEESVEVLVAEQPAIEVIVNGGHEETLYHTPADAGCIGENADHSGERMAPKGEEACAATEEVCEAAAVPPVMPAEKPAQPAAGFFCEECGAAITKSQEQLSQLFMGKALCKRCMDSLQG